MTTIVFESHATTYDNENGLASGHYDIGLSPTGLTQAKELGKRYANKYFDCIYCSDLKRSYNTAKVAFGNRLTIARDRRLRECDYGLLTRKSQGLVEPFKSDHINIPFPQGNFR